MRQFVILLFLIALFVFSCTNKNDSLVLHSPNNNLMMKVLIDNGRVSYQVLHIKNKDTIIEKSDLGLERNDQTFVDDLELVSVSSPVLKTEYYELVSGKRLLNSVDFNEFTVQFKNSANSIIDIVFRAYNDGMAFRYGFPGKDENTYTILKEATTFNIPEEGEAWIQPYDTLGIWSPAYEYGYEKTGSIGETAPMSTGWGFPALFHSKEYWILITESGLDTTYCAAHLSAECSNGEYAIEFPAKWENYGM